MTGNAGKAYMMFKAGCQYYALRVDQIDKVVGIERNGIHNGGFDLDGKRIKVIDLHKKEEADKSGAKRCDGVNIAVCQVNQQKVGVSLGTLWECQDMRIKSVHESHRKVLPKDKPFVAGSIVDGADNVMILDLEKMASDAPHGGRIR